MISIEFREWINDRILDYLPTDRIKRGDKILVRCPLCGDSKKNSMKKRGYYYTKTATYHCFNCDETLTGMKLLERLSGMDYSSLKEEYFRLTYNGSNSNRFQTYVANDRKKTNGNIFNLKTIVKSEWKHDLTESAKSYLEGRMVLKAPFLKEKLYSFMDKKNNEYILIPWIINGKECYYQINDFERHNQMGMKYIFPKNTDKMVYGLDNVDVNFKYLFLTEGVYDSIFIPNGICIGGKTLSDLQEDIIRRRFPNHRLIFNLDNDKPAFETAEKIITSGRYRDFGFFKWFDDNTKQKDINDFIKSINNPNFFSDEKNVEKYIVDPLTMKMWLNDNYRHINVKTKNDQYEKMFEGVFKW